MRPTRPLATSGPVSPVRLVPAATARLLGAAALSLTLGTVPALAATSTTEGAAPGAGPAAVSASAAERWPTLPLETLGDDHRVREGHVATPAERSADAERAASGEVIGTRPALVALSRRHAARGDAHHPDRDDGHGQVWVADLGVLLRGDRDRDGFFGGFELSIDVDTDDREREVYAVFELTDENGHVSLRHDTATFTVYGSSLGDEYRIEVELLENHPAGYRDLAIDIRDARDGRLLDALSPHTYRSLAALPLESDDGVAADDGYPHEDTVHHGPDEQRIGEDDAFVAGYAAANGPVGALVLLTLALLRLRFRRAPDATTRRAP